MMWAGAAGVFPGSPAISPDQRSVAVEITSGSQSDIWLQDVGRDVMSRFTFRPGINRNMVWAPDGKRLACGFQDPTVHSWDIYVKPSGGGGGEELLLHGGVNAYPMDWSSDGRWIVYQQQGQATGLDLWLLPLEGDRSRFRYTPSPDGQRFLMNVPVGGQAPAGSPITVVLNWTAGLKR